MVSIMASPTNSVRDMRAGRLGLAGDRVHGGGDRATFAERRPDRAERHGHRCGENADDFDPVHDLVPFSGARGPALADGAADEDHGEHGEDVGLHRAGQQIERHQRDRHEQAGQRQDDADDEDAAHDVAEQADDQREGARELSRQR